jgi:hypothetical protein
VRCAAASQPPPSLRGAAALSRPYGTACSRCRLSSTAAASCALCLCCACIRSPMCPVLSALMWMHWETHDAVGPGAEFRRVWARNERIGAARRRVRWCAARCLLLASRPLVSVPQHLAIRHPQAPLSLSLYTPRSLHLAQLTHRAAWQHTRPPFTLARVPASRSTPTHLAPAPHAASSTPRCRL